MDRFMETFFKHLRNISKETKKEVDSIKEREVIKESKENQKYAIFITHSIEDKKLAGFLKDLFEEMGVSSFVAHDDIEKGLDWKPEIINSLNNSNLLIVLCTKNIENSPWVNFEIGLGYNKMLPIFIDKLSDRLNYVKSIQGINIDTSNLDKTIYEILFESLKKIGLEKKFDLDDVKLTESYKKFKSFLSEMFNIKKSSLIRGLKDGL